jgi:hypothetical protein
MFLIAPHLTFIPYALANVVLLSLIKVGHRNHTSFYFATSYPKRSFYWEVPNVPKKLVMNARGDEYGEMTSFYE